MKRAVLISIIVLMVPNVAQAQAWITRADTLEAWRSLAPETIDAFTWETTEASWYNSPSGNILQFASYIEFRNYSGLYTGSVMYDPERWPLTPAIERKYPRLYMHRFVELGHKLGQRVILAPSPGLAIPDPKCRNFIYCGYLEIPTDVFLLQSQNWICHASGDSSIDLARFKRFIRLSAARVASHMAVELSVWNAHKIPCHRPNAVMQGIQAAAPYADSYALWGQPADTAGIEVMDLIR